MSSSEAATDDSEPVRLEDSEPVCLEDSEPVRFEDSEPVRLEDSEPVRLEDSEPVRLMALAYDRVLDLLPGDVDRSDEMRREVALYIVDQFRLGEHDPERLSDLALARLAPSGQELDDVGLVPAGD
jgi:hypothetical protein